MKGSITFIISKSFFINFFIPFCSRKPCCRFTQFGPAWIPRGKLNHWHRAIWWRVIWWRAMGWGGGLQLWWHLRVQFPTWYRGRSNHYSRTYADHNESKATCNQAKSLGNCWARTCKEKQVNPKLSPIVNHQVLKWIRKQIIWL